MEESWTRERAGPDARPSPLAPRSMKSLRQRSRLHCCSPSTENAQSTELAQRAKAHEATSNTTIQAGKQAQANNGQTRKEQSKRVQGATATSGTAADAGATTRRHACYYTA